MHFILFIYMPTFLFVFVLFVSCMHYFFTICFTFLFFFLLYYFYFTHILLWLLYTHTFCMHLHFICNGFTAVAVEMGQEDRQAGGVICGRRQTISDVNVWLVWEVRLLILLLPLFLVPFCALHAFVFSFFMPACCACSSIHSLLMTFFVHL